MTPELAMSWTQLHLDATKQPVTAPNIPQKLRNPRRCPARGKSNFSPFSPKGGNLGNYKGGGDV